MTMMFNAVDFIHRLEGEGLSRGAAAAIAASIDAGRNDLVTKTDLLVVKTDFEASLAHALARQTIQLRVMLGAGLAIVVAAIGLIVSAH